MPFAISSFVQGGYYNFCLSFIFLFLSIGFFVRNVQSITLFKGVWLSLLLVLLYFSHASVTLFAVMFLFLFAFWFHVIMADGNFTARFKNFLRSALLLLIVTMPASVLIFAYAGFHESTSEFIYLNLSELLTMFWRISPLVGHGPGEHPHTLIYLIVIVFLTGFVTYKVLKNGISAYQWKKEDVLLPAAVILVIGYFVLPDGDGSGGYVSKRILYIFFLVLMLRLLLVKIPSWLKVDICIVALITFYLQLENRKIGQAIFTAWAKMTVEASTFIEPNSTVLPIDQSDVWLSNNLPSYLGVKKPLVILNNYEASHFYFPLQWKENPPIHTTWYLYPDPISKRYFSHFDNMKILPDYLFFYGYNDLPMPEGYEKSDSADYLLKYELIHQNDFCDLYRIRK